MAKKATSRYDNRLLDAMTFIKCAQQPSGLDNSQFCMIAEGSLRAFDGLIAAGTSIGEPFKCCPQTSRMIHALSSCVEGYTITEAAKDRLLVQSGDFAAYVPLINGAGLTWPTPDAKFFVANDMIKAALKAVVGCVNEKSDHIHEASILLEKNWCMSTNGTVILAAFHGIDLPPNILLPKRIVKALLNSYKPITGIGFGQTTITFWFEDDSWIRSQRYNERWPADDVKRLFSQPFPNPMPTLPEKLFTAMAELAPFSEDGQIYCMNGRAKSHPFATDESAYSGQLTMDVSGINASRAYQLESLKLISPFAKWYEDQLIPGRTFVFGSQLIKIGKTAKEKLDINVRGVMSHRVEQVAGPRSSSQAGNYTGVCASCDGTGCDDCVPF